MLSKALSEPRSGSGLKYHSDAVTLVSVKASRRPHHAARVALFASVLQAASSRLAQRKRLTARRINATRANAVPQPNNQFFASPRPTRPRSSRRANLAKKTI